MTRSTSDIGLEALVADSTDSTGAAHVWALAAGAAAMVGLAMVDREQQRLIEIIQRVPKLRDLPDAESIELDDDTVDCFRESVPYDEEAVEERMRLLERAERLWGQALFRTEEPEDKPSKSQYRWGPIDRLYCLEWLERYHHPEAKHYAFLLGREPFLHAWHEVHEGRWRQRQRRSKLGGITHHAPRWVYVPGNENVHIELFNVDVRRDKLGANVSELARAMLDVYGIQALAPPPWPDCKLGPPKTHDRRGRRLPPGDRRLGERSAQTRGYESALGGAPGCVVAIRSLERPTSTRPRRLQDPLLARRVISLVMDLPQQHGPRPPMPVSGSSVVEEEREWIPEITVLHEGEDQPRLAELEYADQSDAPHIEK